MAFKFLLKLEDGEPGEPAAFETVVPAWMPGDIIPLGRGEELRVLAVETDIQLDEGFDGVLIVRPA